MLVNLGENLFKGKGNENIDAKMFIENFRFTLTGTCFIQKIYAPSSSLLQGKYMPLSPSPLRLNIFRLFVILSLTQSGDVIGKGDGISK